MKRSETIGELAKALAAFHATVTNPRADKTADTGKFTYQYVDFAALLDTDRTLLAAQGLSVVQELVVTPSVVGAATTILHESGEWLELEPAFIPAGDSAQDYGAAASYSRRYSYMAALDLAGADDGATPPAAKAKSAGPGASTEAQQKKIAIEAKEAGLEDELKTVLAKRYQVDSTKQLTKAQASGLIERLIAEKERRASAAAAGADPDTGEVADEPAVEPDDGEDFWPEEEPPGMDAEQFKETLPEPTPIRAPKVTQQQLGAINRLLKSSGIYEAEFMALLDKHGAARQSELSKENASKVIAALEGRLGP